MSSPLHEFETLEAIDSAKGDPCIEAQLFAQLPFARMMMQLGITPHEDFGLLEFDSIALAFAQKIGRVKLPPKLLAAVKRVSLGNGYRPSRQMQAKIEARARKLIDEVAAPIMRNQSSKADTPADRSS
jgi:hypothetical protein